MDRGTRRTFGERERESSNLLNYPSPLFPNLPPVSLSLSPSLQYHKEANTYIYIYSYSPPETGEGRRGGGGAPLKCPLNRESWGVGGWAKNFYSFFFVCVQFIFYFLEKQIDLIRSVVSKRDNILAEEGSLSYMLEARLK